MAVPGWIPTFPCMREGGPVLEMALLAKIEKLSADWRSTTTLTLARTLPASAQASSTGNHLSMGSLCIGRARCLVGYIQNPPPIFSVI
jgi:hypothetical protein